MNIETKTLSFGVYLISVRLSAEELDQSEDFSFEMPEFEYWLFRPAVDDSPYKTPRPKGMIGKIHPFLGLMHKGKWEFILQANGKAEVANSIPGQVSRSDVEEALRSAIEYRLQERSAKK